MNRRDILDTLAFHRQELRLLGVRSLALFGSAARDQAGETSDVDLLVEFDDARPIGLFELARLQRRLQQILGAARVDLVTREGIHPALRDRILREAIRAA